MRARLACALLVSLAVGLALGGGAAALPANPWTGQWLAGTGATITLTQTGSSISGTSLCPFTTSLPGINYTGTASPDNTTASFSYAGAPVCPGDGGTFSGTMASDALKVSGSGVSQFGTGFTFSWTYQGGGTEPRGSAPPTTPPPPPTSSPGPVAFRYVGFSNDRRPVTLRRFQLGVVRMRGSGTLATDGTATGRHVTTFDQRFVGLGRTRIEVEILDGTLVVNTASVRRLRLRARVISSTRRRNCAVGTEGDIFLTDSTKTLRNGHSKDKITTLWPVATCPTYNQGVSNEGSPNSEPPTGGPGNGRFAKVAIAVS